jgi:multidrug resistance efflux pump
VRAVGLVALVALAGLGCGHADGARELVEVERSDLVLTVEVSGQLAAVDSTDIKPPVLADTPLLKISWLAPETAELAAGAPVVAFDASELERGVATLEAQIAESRLRLAQARESAARDRRQQELQRLELEASARKARLQLDVPPDLVAQLKLRGDQLDAEDATADLAHSRDDAAYARHASDAEIQAQIDTGASLARQVAELERGIAQLKLTAPRAGTVVYPITSGTDKRKLGDTVYRSDVVVQVVGLGAMAGNGVIDEADLARVAPHEPVTLRIDALPDVALRGTVGSIAPTVQRSEVDPSNVVRVQIAIAPTPAALRPGMRFRGQIETQRIPGVIQVPAEAVFVTSAGPVAYREAAGGLEPVPLALGRRSLETVEVTSGLAPGDRVSRVAPAQGAR